jgi:1,2-diacylglycerol 3-alpha-glucosyltransferase
MNIALFTETYLPYINGVVTHVKSLKDGLERAGHNVLIVAAAPKTRRHYIDENGVLWCPAKEFKRFYDYGLASPISLKRLRLIKKFNPDIIHIHNEFGVGLSGIAIAKLLKVPLVYTLHTMYDDYLYYVAPKPLIPMMRRVSHRYFRFLGKRAGAITGPSKKVQEFLSECGVAKEVNVVPNPVELDKFQEDCVDPQKVAAYKEQYHIQDDELVVCFCGRLGREKSVDVLLDYFAKMVDRKDKIRLLIIGHGPNKEELEQQAKDLGIDDVVTFTGKILHDDLVNVYACCDLYVTTSLSDTNSISMLEAMATGLPVLHRFDKLNEGQVRSGINGFIFYGAEDMYQYMLKYRDFTPEQKLALKHSVIESVKKSGQENLAKYLLDVYHHLEEEQKNKKGKHGRRRKVSVYELDVTSQNKK